MNTTTQSRELVMRHQQAIKNRQQSMLGRANVEIGMPLNQMRRYNGTIQGKVHSDFRTAYDRSSASLS
ncbi:hypothetical protein [Synechococcus elongatus]|uniref:Glutamine synthetase inactivating factor IF7 n=2 Tax=Synechococcus elongatus TaxID=32046 RepID=A0AAN1QNA5_SYNEL|nr:hypothetical protein [Synechococcus elongatus]AZB72540.1 hypothetical protein DOP62_07255 [Synechococcus elongatus PCC 11801]QFZ92164.1 hypothetical protein EKO22_07095 [Synechococcus elongatus PCC 11802]